ncbi:ATP synthase subunit I [Paenibacillus pasadenensis]|uniref:ATP synthase subunit I n=1 Tax=Paenibacillus pasadenensis TaxID=217090 RepID=UPI00203A6641|nr:ATP synthase subunit I [Paenibacillus pasadenensis]MCM3747604.1 ATP synthase subunit I [Paenibacillus pasadenensis]
MNEVLKVTKSAVLLLFAICLLLWAFVPEWRTVAAGCMLGIAAGSFNTFLLRRRVEWIGVMAQGDNPRRAGTGMAGRLAMVLLAVMIAYRFPDQVNLPATLASCFAVPFVILVCAFFTLRKQRSGKG